MLILPATVTHEQAPACLNMLMHTLRADKSQDVVADASALEKFDSSALAVLLACWRQTQRDGRRFAVRGLPPRLRELAQLYGVAELLLPA